MSLFQLLFKLVLKLITKLFSLLLSPIVAGLTLLFPDFSTIYSSVNDFIVIYLLQYMNTILDLLLIPKEIFYLLLDYFLAILSIQLFVVTFKLVLNVYNKLKP